jgi:hypothetical protein
MQEKTAPRASAVFECPRSSRFASRARIVILPSRQHVHEVDFKEEITISSVESQDCRHSKCGKPCWHGIRFQSLARCDDDRSRAFEMRPETPEEDSKQIYPGKGGNEI